MLSELPQSLGVNIEIKSPQQTKVLLKFAKLNIYRQEYGKMILDKIMIEIHL